MLSQQNQEAADPDDTILNQSYLNQQSNRIEMLKNRNSLLKKIPYVNSSTISPFRSSLFENKTRYESILKDKQGYARSNYKNETMVTTQSLGQKQLQLRS
jgi:hypothetical protein